MCSETGLRLEDERNAMAEWQKRHPDRYKISPGFSAPQPRVVERETPIPYVTKKGTEHEQY